MLVEKLTITKIQVRTSLEDAKINLAIFTGLPDRSLLNTILFQPDHHIETHTLHRKPCRIRAIVLM